MRSMGCPFQGNQIRAFHTSTRTSVLVNRSPTDQFVVRRGLRQGDLLSHFVFILSKEGLHIAMHKAQMLQAISGMRLGGRGRESSHFYIDDAVFLCDWSLENVRCILSILRCCFSQLRVLKSTYLKGNLLMLLLLLLKFSRLQKIQGVWLSSFLYIFGTLYQPTYESLIL